MGPDVLDSLYREHYGPALLYCIALCGDEQLAQDLVADAFVKAYLGLPDRIPSFRWWLLRVCRNQWTDHLRKNRKLQGSKPLELLTAPDTPETIYIRNERSRILWQALGTLQPHDRELVTLHYFSGLSLKEAAVLLGLSYTTARQRMVRLRHTIKTYMEEQGYGI